MKYEEIIDYLYKQLPMFHRIGAAAYKADLDNTIALCDMLGNPQHHFKTVHIAGTNGKGSTSHMLASVLMAAGYKVGLYTSPHLKDFRERIKINGKEIPRSYVTQFVLKHKKGFETIKPSFFEWTVGLCFDYFSSQKVDIAIIETGLGGRLDSTNVINPLVSVITNIGLDHTDLLGNTLGAIATEKAGIIKPRTPVVIGETHPETAEIFTNTATSLNAPIFFADQHFRVQRAEMAGRRLELDITDEFGIVFPALTLDLTGIYQQKNILTVLQTLHMLRQRGFKPSEKQLYYALRYAAKNTRLRGRWEVLDYKPLIVCDTAHNTDGISEVVKQIARTPHSKLHIVLGMVGDKDVAGVLALLPKNAAYYFCNADMPRALAAADLQQKASSFSLTGKHYESVQVALAQAKANAATEDMVYIGGSTFVVAEAL